MRSFFSIIETKSQYTKTLVHSFSFLSPISFLLLFWISRVFSCVWEFTQWFSAIWAGRSEQRLVDEVLLGAVVPGITQATLSVVRDLKGLTEQWWGNQMLSGIKLRITPVQSLWSPFTHLFICYSWFVKPGSQAFNVYVSLLDHNPSSHQNS